MAGYIIGIDQSTQGTKVMLFDQQGRLCLRVNKNHAQLIDQRDYVEHDPEEIYDNLIELVGQLIQQSGIDPEQVKAVGISNQRETALAWFRSGKPVYNAIVWQCARGASICDRIAAAGYAEMIRNHTGLQLSPYFSAAKLAWIMENVPGVIEKAVQGEVLCGTVDCYLVYRLTHGAQFRTDYSNASRTQLFNISTLRWDQEILELFGIPACCMAEVTDSDGLFGYTDFEGVLPHPVPIHGVMGDSHGALFGQGCLSRGMMKATYGTGSSIMMNIGERPSFSELGLVTSLAWKTHGKVQYVLEGNINYTGAVITWLKDDVGLLQSPGESEVLACAANVQDHTYLVPAFSGLGAPYWRSDVSAAMVGMSRSTGKAEIVKAALESIAYQITDIVNLMKQEAGIDHLELRVDGGPSRNRWLMQFQSDILNCTVMVPSTEELSGMGAAYAAGLGCGLYSDDVFANNRYTSYVASMEESMRNEKYNGWKTAVAKIL